MLLRPATTEDIPAILALERLPASAQFVGQWTEGRHLATLMSPDACYYASESENSDLRAYVILRGLAESSGSIELKRLVVHPAGQGLGRRILGEVLRIAFEEFHAHRVFLDVFDDNARAIHLYSSFGFVEEGLMREAAIRDGMYCSLRLMSLLEREYAARKG
jgi:RimJ/RimL family protein N-acetyltransferase